VTAVFELDYVKNCNADFRGNAANFSAHLDLICYVWGGCREVLFCFALCR